MIDNELKIVVNLISKEKKIENVYCEIKLPKSDKEEIYINCFPTTDQFKEMIGSHKFKIIGKPYDKFCFYDQIIVRDSIITKILPNKISKTEKSYLIIILCMDFYGEYEKSNIDKNKSISGWFYVSLLASLSPNKVLDCKPSGEINVTPYSTHKFSLDKKFTISFDTKYYYDSQLKYDEQIANVSYFKNVAEFNFRGSIKEVEHYSTLLDDLLMLMSFAIRKRTVCTGWIAESSSKYIIYIKRNIVIPSYKDENLLPNYLVEPNDLKIFLDHTFSKLYNLKHKEIIKRAIFPVPSANETGTEPSILLLFSCLESILLYHKKNKNYETIIDEDSFHIIRNDIARNLKQLLKSYKSNDITKRKSEVLKKYDSTRRKMFYDKISELNRPSFKMILEDFCSDYSLVLDDLWPITDSETGISLSEIRNKLIHGEVFDPAKNKSLIVAEFHLQAIVERMILKILEWDIKKTRVAKEKITNNAIFREDLKYHMKSLS